MTTPWLFAVSTLGVVDETVQATAAMFRRHGVRAVELRSAAGAFVHPDLPPARRSAVRELFAESGTDIVAVASRVKIAADGDDDDVTAALARELQLAADLGARYVRVFPGAPVAPTTSDAVPQLLAETAAVDARAVRRLLRVADTAANLGVRPVIETHDSHPRGDDVARVLRRLDDEAPGHPVGAIWDVLHPWRVGESLRATAEALTPYLLDDRGYVQVKDVAHPADTTPVLQGSGTVPVDDMLDLLDAAGYRGPVSLEWERFWNPQVPPLEDALAAAARVVRAHPPTGSPADPLLQ